MLYKLSIKNNIKKRFSAGNRLNIFINIKRLFYKIFQKMFNKFIFLIHHDFVRQFYVNINVSHERNFKVIVYHVKKEKITYNKKNIKFILFLNKILILIESRY